MKVLNAKSRKLSFGVTLTEILVAIIILGVVLVGVSVLLTGDLRLRRSSVTSNTASQLAASYMESIKRAWSVPENYESPVGQSFGVLPAAPSDARYSALELIVDISCLMTDGTPVTCAGVRSPDLRRVRISVNSSGELVTSLVSEVGRPFEPGRTR